MHFMHVALMISLLNICMLIIKSAFYSLTMFIRNDDKKIFCIFIIEIKVINIFNDFKLLKLIIVIIYIIISRKILKIKLIWKFTLKRQYCYARLNKYLNLILRILIHFNRKRYNRYVSRYFLDDNRKIEKD